MTDFEQFLGDADVREIPWTKPSGAPVSLTTDRVLIADGTDALEVAVASAATRPKVDEVRRLWASRWGRRAAPVVLVVAYLVNGTYKAAVCGTKDDPAVLTDLDLSQVERICAAALNTPNSANAERTLHRLLVGQKDQLVAGLTNAGLFASHELRAGVPGRVDWQAEQRKGQELLRQNGVDLIRGLGFNTTPHGSTALILTAEDNHRAVAVLLEEHELFDRPTARFGTVSPVAQGLTIAQQQGLPWLVVVRGTQIRLYSGRPDVGVGRKGQAETFTEIDLALLSSADAAYLPLIFSAGALAPAGSVDQILEASADHAAALGQRLRERVYENVVPDLAEAVARRMDAATETELDEAYHRTLIILFRLLFVAYAEDRGLLPYLRNPRYTKKALKTVAREFAENSEPVFDTEATDRWDDLLAVWRAVDDGNREWGVPAYNGGLFASDDNHPSGRAIAAMQLTNDEIGPALHALLIDTGDEGTRGPVDFRSLTVREFGTIYEGLLESSVSIAPTDLTVNPKTKFFLPAKSGQVPDVKAGQVYFHNASGARKSSGSYFTKAFAVEHLLDTALEPALVQHLARIETYLKAGDEARAAEALFDFRVADLAMGSGHFLVAAIDRIEARFRVFLSNNPIPAVADELRRLTEVARDALAETAPDIEIEPSSFLRRQIGRRCIYGLDLNLMAVELARLGIWIHTFVPGLPMSALDHGLQVGNSLTGIASIDEVLRVLDPTSTPEIPSMFDDSLRQALDRASDRLRRVARTSEATKQEVREASREYRKAREEATVARALCDAALALRLGLANGPILDEDGAISVASRPAVAPVLAQLQAVHLPVLFPEVFVRDRPGFDVILGNPPWDKVRHEPKQFWVVRDPGLNALPANKRDARVDELRLERPAEAAEERAEHALRERLQQVARTGFNLLGSGHFDFAKLFAERFLGALREGGSLGIVMPQTLLLLGGWSKLRTALLDRGDVAAVEARNTGGWLFEDVHKSYAVVLLSIRRPLDASSNEVSILPGVTDMDRFRRAKAAGGMKMTVADLDALSEGRVVPWFNDPNDATVFSVVRAQPTLLSGDGWISGKSDSSRWDFSGSGKHKAYAATTKSSTGAWAVLMTRHVDQYQIADDPIQRWVNDLPALAAAHPTRGMRIVNGQAQLTDDHPVITYRFPSRNDDSRTVIATAMPGSGYFFSTGYSHGISHPTGTAITNKLALLGYLNTIVADWWARRFVDRHVGSRIINGMKLPNWSDMQCNTASRLTSELLVRGGLGVLPGGHPVTSDPALHSRTDVELRVELDKLALDGFGLNTTHAEVILGDFKETADSIPLSYRELLFAAMTKGPVG